MKDDLKAVLQDLVDAYFVRRDYPVLMKMLAEDFTMIGTGAAEQGGYADMEYYFGNELEIYDGSFTVTDLQTKISHVTPDVAVAEAEMTVSSDPATGYVVHMPLRFTVVLRKEHSVWKIVHVHNSVPYGEQGNETYFNREVARQNYHLLETAAQSMAEERVAEARLLDPLTGILNLEGFVERAHATLAECPDTRFALLKFNVNRFRYINQSYGYNFGDQILQEIAARLQSACGPKEVCGRIEKDNFALLMVFRGQEKLDLRMADLRQLLLGGRYKDRLQSVTLTGGIYLLPVGAPDREMVKDMLDKAMMAQQLVASSPGQSQYAYYSPKVDALQYRRTQLAELAPAAMKNGEFKLYIQPQVSLVTGRPVAGEALVRWAQPDGTMMLPGEFIPLFEQNDFILTFDFHMLEIVCRQMRAWIDAGVLLKPISINQSRSHLRYPDYLERFCDVVDKYEIPHNYIAFELTESAFIECNDLMLQVARELHQRGFLLDIDDFGTGYASLNLLGLVAADVLKIDRSLLVDFDTNPRSKIILRKVIEMARETKMTTICEGIETQAQADFLRELGCDMGQGFLFYRPMPAEQFEKEVLQKHLVHA